VIERLKPSKEHRTVSSSKLRDSKLKLSLAHASCPPASWGDFFDVRITRVEPPGLAVIGQRFYGESGPSLLRIGLKFEYTEVNVAQHKLGLNVQLPFGITVREDLDCIPLSSTQCRVNYHCNFGFAKGWRGAITRTIMRRKLDAGPVDSLSRLKRAAEQGYTNSQV
jgi:hypothetical protein